MTNRTGKGIVLEELRTAFDKIYAAGDTLDAKLNNLLTFSSLIVSVAATIQVSAFADKVGMVFWALLGIVLIMYLINYYEITRGLNPSEYFLNVKGDRNTMLKKYFRATSEQMTRQVIWNHLDSIEKAKTTNQRKVKAITLSFRMLAIIVVILLLAVPMGFIFPTPTLPNFVRRIRGN